MLASWTDCTKTRQQWTLTSTSLQLANLQDLWGDTAWINIMEVVDCFLPSWVLRERRQANKWVFGAVDKLAHVLKQNVVNGLQLLCLRCLHNWCPLASLCYTMTSLCLQDLPFHNPVYNTTSMQAGSFVMEDNWTECSRGQAKRAPCFVWHNNLLPLPAHSCIVSTVSVWVMRLNKACMFVLCWCLVIILHICFFIQFWHFIRLSMIIYLVKKNTSAPCLNYPWV